jgi:phosphomannomutase
MRRRPSIAGATVTEVTDFRTGADTRPAWLGEHDLVAFTLDEGRVMIRPSGTEPKCKIYVDVRADLCQARRTRTSRPRSVPSGASGRARRWTCGVAGL